MSPELQHAYHDNVCTLASIGPCVIAHWFGAPTSAAAVRLRRLLEATASRHERLVYTGLIRAKTSIPETKARRDLIDALLSERSKVGAIAMVVEGPPLYASAVRAALAGMSLLVRTSIEIRVFGEDADALRFVAAKVATPNTSRSWVLALERAFTSVRERSAGETFAARDL